ncbi:hypothetical protein KXX44_008840, partial [Aspergillus fumigatus]
KVQRNCQTWIVESADEWLIATKSAKIQISQLLAKRRCSPEQFKEIFSLSLINGNMMPTLVSGPTYNPGSAILQAGGLLKAIGDGLALKDIPLQIEEVIDDPVEAQSTASGVS